MADRIFYSDLPLDLTVSSQGDLSTVDNAKAISQSLNMIVNTGRGTRVFMSDYGCRIRAFLFEPFDETTARRMGEELRLCIGNFEPRVQLLNLDVNMDMDNASYDISIVYRVLNTNTVEQTNVTLEKL